MGVFKTYRRRAVIEVEPWVKGYDTQGVSVNSAAGRKGSPKAGDVIARNPKDYTDRWLITEQQLKSDFEIVNNL